MKVFIIASHAMFGRGLESLLRQQSNLQIVGFAQDGDKALPKIEAFRPDIVIIYGDDKSSDHKVMVVDVLNVSPQSKVIGLNLQNNLSFAYQTALWVTRDEHGLINLINNHSPDSLISESKGSLQA